MFYFMFVKFLSPPEQIPLSSNTPTKLHIYCTSSEVLLPLKVLTQGNVIHPVQSLVNLHLHHKAMNLIPCTPPHSHMQPLLLSVLQPPSIQLQCSGKRQHLFKLIVLIMKTQEKHRRLCMTKHYISQLLEKK